MAMDTPARIAIIGAGPIGLEAALYARFLGYDVDLYERQQVAEHILRWGHVRMFTPFRLNATPLALGALECQDPAYRAPGEDALLLGSEFAEKYLIPLSRTDLLSDSVHERTTVLAVAREPMPEEDVNDALEADEVRFRLKLQNAKGELKEATADVVIDTSGALAQARGLDVTGADACEDLIEFGVPDVLDRGREQYAGRHTLVVGTGLAAAQTVVDLAELARREPDTRVTWITGSLESVSDSGPIELLPNDPLLARNELATKANRLATAKVSSVEFLGSQQLSAVANTDEGLTVTIAGADGNSQLSADRLVVDVGHQPELDMLSELDFGQGFPFTEISAAIEPPGIDWSGNAEMLVTAEPNFYILGSKSFGANSAKFLLRMGHRQIIALFSLIGENPRLNLYQSPPR